MCRPKHVEQLRNIGIINSTTRLHLVGPFYEVFSGSRENKSPFSYIRVHGKSALVNAADVLLMNAAMTIFLLADRPKAVLLY